MLAASFCKHLSATATMTTRSSLKRAKTEDEPMKKRARPERPRKRAKVQEVARRTTTAADLPEDLLKCIFAFLPCHTVSTLRRVCLAWNNGPIMRTNITLHSSNTFEFERIIKGCHPKAVRTMDLESSYTLSPSGLECFANFTNMVDLTLSHCPRLDLSLIVLIGGLSQLSTLKIGYCPLVNDAGLAALAGLQRLVELELSACHNISDAGMAHVANLLSLQKIELSHCPQITEVGIACFRDLDLTYFEMKSSHVTDAVMHQLQHPTLTHLDVSKNAGVTDLGLRHLSKRLEHVNLSSCNVTDRGLACLPPTVQEVHIEECPNVVGTWLSENEWPNLSKLNASMSGMFYLRDCKNFPKLDSLDLSWCPFVTLDVLKAFSRSKVTNLDISNCQLLTRDAAKCLRSMSSLKRLTMSGQSLASLARLASLQSLEINNLKHVTAKDLNALSSSASLISLSLSEFNSTLAGFKSIGKMKNLQTLALMDTNLDDRGLEILTSLPSLRTLDVRSSAKITNAGLAFVGKHPKLEKFSMAFCSQMNDVGAKNLSQSKSLREVRCFGCFRITIFGFRLLAAMPTIEHLHRNLYPRTGTRHQVRGSNIYGHVRC